MSQHEFCEDNQANWYGIRPGIDGDDTTLNYNITNATTLIYTVPAGKIFLIFDWTFSLRNSSGAYKQGWLSASDTTPAVYVAFVNLFSPNEDSKFAHQEYFVPLRLLAGYTINGFASAANVTIFGTIHGILINA